MTPSSPANAAAIVLQLLENGSSRVVKKPWGSEFIVTTDAFLLKYIEVNDGHQTSLQHHEIKDEVQYILTAEEPTPGRGSGIYVRLQDGDEPVAWQRFGAGEHVRVQPGWLHRTCGPCTLIEVTTLHNDDVIRHEDDYDRTTPIKMQPIDETKDVW